MSELIHVLASNDELLAEALDLSEQRAQTYLTETRKDDFTRKMSYIWFEIQQRENIVLLDKTA